MGKSDLIAIAVRAGLGEEADFSHVGEHLQNVKTGDRYIAKAGGKQVYGEGLGLQKIASACPTIAPRVYVCEKADDGSSHFISDYVDLGRSDRASMKALAEKMASEMHNPSKQEDQQQFGFPVPTHCGVTEQDNTWESDWMTFYRDHRLGDMLSQIRSKKGDNAEELLRLGNRVQEEVCPALLCNFSPPAKPVILHGDLWSGNVRTNADTGEPIILDCSCYYGHNEADFGISHMFSSKAADHAAVLRLTVLSQHLMIGSTRRITVSCRNHSQITTSGCSYTSCITT